MFYTNKKYITILECYHLADSLGSTPLEYVIVTVIDMGCYNLPHRNEVTITRCDRYYDTFYDRQVAVRNLWRPISVIMAKKKLCVIIPR